MKKILFSISTIIILILLAGTYKFNFTNNYIYVQDQKGYIIPISKELKRVINNTGILLNQTLQKPTNKIFEISFLGDVMIGGRVKDAINKHGLNFTFSGTSDYLSKKDAVVLNLENPVTNSGKKYNKKYIFNADVKHLKGLKTFNKNLWVNLANNHLGDYGKEGIINTFKNLDKNNINYFGAGYNKKEAEEIKILNIHNIKIGLIGQVCIWPTSYTAGKKTPGHAFFNKNSLKKQIQKGKVLGLDLIIYNMHCGDEYMNGPNYNQMNYARFAIDNGADLVIGHHPHWYQPIEIYKGKMIFYSLGNYIFDIDRSIRSHDGIIANIVIKNKKIIKADIIPITIEGFGKTKFPLNNKKKKILNEIYNLSKKFKDIPSIKDGYILLNQ